MSISIFMYHDIREISNSYFPKRYLLKSFLRPDTFRKQIKYISTNYEVITPNDFSYINAKSDNYAVITFDDGLSDHYHYGYNILKDFNLKGMFFLPIEAISKRIMCHVHKTQFILAAINEKQLVKETLDNVEKYASQFNLVTNSRNDILNKFKKPLVKDNWWSEEMIFITRFFREFSSFEFRDYLLGILFNKYVSNNEKEFVSNFYLDFKQIQSLIDMGMLIGGHGYYSLNAKNENINMQKNEILKCYQFISRDIFHSKTFKFYYSYPQGRYTNTSLRTLAQLECIAAFTTENKKYTSQNNLKIPRYNPAIDLKRNLYE